MKYFKLLFVAIFAFALSATFISCGGDDSSDRGNNNIDNPDNGQGTVSNALSEDEQKNILEQTARELIAEINASDFQAITDITDYVNYNMSSSRQTEALDNWLEAAMKLTNGDNSNGVIKAVYLASNFTGAFSFNGKQWEQTRKGGNNLQFTFPDKNGTSCVLLIETSGNTYRIHHGSFDNYEYDWRTYTETRYENTIGVPENVSAKLTQGSKTLASVTVHTVINSSTDINLARDVAEVTINASVSNYTITIDKAIYRGGSTASANVVLQKGSKTLISATVSADIKLNSEGEVSSFGKAQVYADALGKVQLNGQISDYDRFTSYTQMADKDWANETNFKKDVDNINSLLNVGLYFNGSNTRMSYLQYYPFKYSYYGEEEWYAVPVIYFRDGSAYSTIESFFDERTYSTVITRFNNLVRDFEHLVK